MTGQLQKQDGFTILEGLIVVVSVIILAALIFLFRS